MQISDGLYSYKRERNSSEVLAKYIGSLKDIKYRDPIKFIGNSKVITESAIIDGENIGKIILNSVISREKTICRNCVIDEVIIGSEYRYKLKDNEINNIFAFDECKVKRIKIDDYFVEDSICGNIVRTININLIIRSTIGHIHISTFGSNILPA